MKILIVEDQRRAGPLLAKRRPGRTHTVTWVRDCAQAREALSGTSYDLVVLDPTLPDGDGLALLQEWRMGGVTHSVLVLGERDAGADRLKGLDFGAADYLPKPFSPEELHARIHSLLRLNVPAEATVLEHRGIVLDLLGRTVAQDGQPVALTSREFALLEIFMHNPGRILPRALISERIWESHADVAPNLLDVYMSKLRAKLEASPGKPFFRTVRGVGYHFL